MVKNRHFGLDCVRAIAITMVVLSHCNVLLNHIHPVFEHFRLFDGVDLFFVLSGLLIGQIILKTDINSLASIQSFLTRRWLRTLPNYYLFLLINILLIAIGIAPGMISKATAYYAVFLQNVYQPIDIMFWESWSLVVEEWFYLLLPILIFSLSKIITTKTRIYLWSVALLFVFSFVAKIAYTHTHIHFHNDLNIRSIALFRFDTLCFGLFLAYLTIYKTTLLRQLKWVGLLVFILYFILRPYLETTINMTLLASAVGCSSLIIFLYDFPQTNVFFKNAIELTSKISYSMYFVHLPLYYVLKPYMIDKMGISAIIYTILYLGLSYFLSFMIYRYYESFFLKWRDKK